MKSQLLVGIIIGWCCAIVIAVISNVDVSPPPSSAMHKNLPQQQDTPQGDVNKWQQSIEEAKHQSIARLQSGEHLDVILTGLEQRARHRNHVTAMEIEAGVAAINQAGGSPEDIHRFTGNMLALQNEFNRARTQDDVNYLDSLTYSSIEQAIFALGIIENPEEFTQLAHTIRRYIAGFSVEEYTNLSDQLQQTLESRHCLAMEYLEAEIATQMSSDASIIKAREDAATLIRDN